MYKTLTILIFTMSLVSVFYQSEGGQLRGFVFEEETGEPVPFANIYIREAERGAESNNEGYYSVSGLEQGTYTVRASFIGYDTVQMRVEIRAGAITTQNFFLVEGGIDLIEFEIEEDRIVQERLRIGTIEPEIEDIERIPSVGGSPDLAQYLQVLPGVVFSGDQGGQLYIRGGSPVQNMTLMDGMTVYNPFHSIGLFSVFDIDAVSDIQVMTGGFGARYGGRTSSVIDISMRGGNRRHHKGKLSLTPFTAKALFEGPIRPFQDDDGLAVSYLFTTRGSFLEQTSPLFYSYADTSGRIPYNFLDGFGKVTLSSRSGNKMSVYGFNFADRVNYPGATSFGWDSYGVGTDFFLMPSDRSTMIEGNFAYSDYEVRQHEADEMPRNSSVSGFESGLHFTYYMDYDRIEYGFDIMGFTTALEFYNPANRLINHTQFSTEAGGYIHYHKNYKKWVFDPGLRLHYYASLGDMQAEPRLAMQYNATHWLRFNAAGGFYSQNLVNSRSDRDVVNLFNGFLGAPSSLPSTFDGETVRSRLQKARHILAGFEVDLFTHSTLTIEGYWKKFNQLISMNRNKVFDNTPEFSHIPLYLKSDFIREEGDAYGIDFKLVYDQRPYYIWLVYSLGKITRFDGQETYAPHWDRRHNVDILAGYRFGENESWEATARWNYGSGFPFTQTRGFYEMLDFQNEGAATDYTRETGGLGIIDGDLNTGRLPNYHRLDVSLKKTIALENNNSLEINASVTNVYNKQNLFYFDRISYSRVDQLPILPSIGISYAY